MNFVQIFSNIPHEIATLLIAMVPIAELRVSIPVALEVYELSVFSSVFFSILGNMVPVTFILWLLPHVHEWILRQKFLGKFFQKLLKRAEGKISGDLVRYGFAIALVIFIGIPLPMTGAWTGSLICFIFNLPFRKSWPIVFAGVCMAATIVTLVTLFAGVGLRWIINL